jgi:hypothetical protein
MDLTIEPEYYIANIDNEGNYIDSIPTFSQLKYGIRCMCGSRKDKIFNNYNSFSAHIRTLCHRNWLISLNTNKQNYYKDCEEMKLTIGNQKLIIARLERELIGRNNTIEQLTNHNITLREQYENERRIYSSSKEPNLLDLDI